MLISDNKIPLDMILGFLFFHVNGTSITLLLLQREILEMQAILLVPIISYQFLIHFSFIILLD